MCCKPQKLILFIGKAKKMQSGTKSGFSILFFSWIFQNCISVKSISNQSNILSFVDINTNFCSWNIDQLHGFLVPVKIILLGSLYIFSIFFLLFNAAPFFCNSRHWGQYKSCSRLDIFLDFKRSFSAYPILHYWGHSPFHFQGFPILHLWRSWALRRKVQFMHLY